MCIHVQNLSFAYEKVLILKEISFQIEENRFIGIFGPNGGGKTTLLKLLMGFLEPQEGKITLFGEKPSLQRKHMAYVPQITGFDKQFPLTVMEMVLMGCLRECNYLGHIPSFYKQKAHEVLCQVGLENKKNASFGELSGGEAQRALIARALLISPKLLFLDEPTASVDSSTEMMLYELLMQLKKTTTILMVSHSLPAMTRLVDGCLLISRNATMLEPEALCQHYAVGLYHPPLTPFNPS